MTPRLIGIKRKPCEVSQIPNGTSRTEDIRGDNNLYTGGLNLSGIQKE